MILHSSIGKRLLVKALHNGDSGSHHGAPQVLDDVEAVKDDSSLWK